MMLQTGAQRAVFFQTGNHYQHTQRRLAGGYPNEDQIEVIIQKGYGWRFFFSFSINGTVLNSLPDVSVMLPYPNDPAARHIVPL